jgi:hypothetical protein
MDVSGLWESEGSARRSATRAVFTVLPPVLGHRGPAVRCVTARSASVGPVPVAGQCPRCPQLRSASNRRAARSGMATRVASLSVESRSAGVLPSQLQGVQLMSVPNQRLVPTLLHYRGRAAQAHRWASER